MQESLREQREAELRDAEQRRKAEHWLAIVKAQNERERQRINGRLLSRTILASLKAIGERRVFRSLWAWWGHWTFRKWMTLGLSFAYHNMGGKVTKRTYDLRLNVCNGCEFMSVDDRGFAKCTSKPCTEAGDCPKWRIADLRRKTKLRTMGCPIGKWPMGEWPNTTAQEADNG